MKKILALVLCFVLLASISAFAEEAPAPIKIGQVDAAPHGKGCFAVVTAVVQGDVILAAKIDEFQFVSSSETIEAVGVPNSDGSFGSCRSRHAGTDSGKALRQDAAERYDCGNDCPRVFLLV